MFIKTYFKRVYLLLPFLLLSNNLFAWGFFGHQLINRAAVYALPQEMIHFYKSHIRYITENAVNPDKRRYIVEGEAPRHYIDIDIYDPHFGDSAVYKMPRYWSSAVARFSKDTLYAYGVVPWHIQKMYTQLEEAFKQKDGKRILRLSTEIGHYIGDGNVPLHTTENYNGQLSGQLGIHAFWESTVPELYAKDYDLFVGQAEYVDNTQMRAWNGIIEAHEALDSVLTFEKKLTENFPLDKKYAYKYRNNILIKTYSKEFTKLYNKMLAGQVEHRMRQSIKMIADFWYTAWVNAGQPNLEDIIDISLSTQEKKIQRKDRLLWKKIKGKHRSHERIASMKDPLKVRSIGHLIYTQNRKRKRRLIK